MARTPVPPAPAPAPVVGKPAGATTTSATPLVGATDGTIGAPSLLARGQIAVDTGALAASGTPVAIGADALLGTHRTLDVTHPVSAALRFGVPLADASGSIRIDGDCLVIVSRVPGFRRAGMVPPPIATYPLDQFTTTELKLLTREPNLEVIAFGGEPVARDAEAVKASTPTPASGAPAARD